MADEIDTKVETWFRPDWHPSLNPLLGDIKGAHAYITEQGTVRLLGPLHEDPAISKFASSSKIDGPTTMLSANGGSGVLS